MKITDCAAWLRRSRTTMDAWWTLPPEQFRLAIWLLSIADVSDGALRVVCTLEDMARHLAVTRGKLRRMLDALQRVGFCDQLGQRGNGGITMILVRDPPAQISNGALPPGNHTQPCDLTSNPNGREWTPDHQPDPGEIIEPRKQAGHLEVAENPSCGKLAVLDLLRSPQISESDLRSDLRSSTHENITRSTELQLSGRAIWATAEGNATEETGEQPEQPRPSDAVVVAIQDRAWLAADYLRSKVLTEDRSAIVGTRPWSADQKAGLRLTWANEFRLLHSRVLRALRNETPDATEASAWDLIAKTVHWLFHSQPPGGPRFEVESPRSLAKKWDSIQRMRRRPAATRDSNGRSVDPATQHTFKRLGAS